MLGTNLTNNSAIVSSLDVGAPNESENSAVFLTAFIISGFACPTIIGPHELI